MFQGSLLRNSSFKSLKSRNQSSMSFVKRERFGASNRQDRKGSVAERRTIPQPSPNTARIPSSSDTFAPSSRARAFKAANRGWVPWGEHLIFRSWVETRGGKAWQNCERVFRLSL